MLPIGIQNNVGALLAEDPLSNPTAIQLQNGIRFVAFFGAPTDAKADVNTGYYFEDGTLREGGITVADTGMDIDAPLGVSAFGGPDGIMGTVFYIKGPKSWRPSWAIGPRTSSRATTTQIGSCPRAARTRSSGAASATGSSGARATI